MTTIIKGAIHGHQHHEPFEGELIQYCSTVETFCDSGQVRYLSVPAVVIRLADGTIKTISLQAERRHADLREIKPEAVIAEAKAYTSVVPDPPITTEIWRDKAKQEPGPGIQALIDEAHDLARQGLPPHQQRMLAEQDELGERITKLKAFMQGELFVRQSAYEQSDMVIQLDGMVAYYQALGRRITRFQNGAQA